jgi:spermidine synthase
VALDPTASTPVAPTAAAREEARVGAVAVGIAVFFGGAVLLGVEIAASRVLAPFFGNSLFVWGALIGVVLAGLAAGYWIGGAVADRVPGPGLLVGVLGLGALAVLGVPLLDEPILEMVVAWDPGPRANPLVASILLFGVPSIVLAAVSPIAVRLRVRSLAGVGSTAGRLFALSTAGSITGTFATAFWLIPEFGTDQLLAMAAAALFAAVVLVALETDQLVAAGVAAAATAAAIVAAVALAPDAGGTLSGASARNWSPLYRVRGAETYLDARDPGAAAPQTGLDVVFSRDTQYHRLAVVDDEDSRYLRFDNSLQSAMYLDRPFATRFRYTDFFHLGLAYNPGARDILFIGLGGGSSPKRMWREFPELRLTVVELDPVVVDVGYRYFAVPRDERLRIEVDDGRRYLDEHDQRWDVIVIDAFFADAIPFHLVTHEFLQLARQRLNPGGVIVTNAIGAIDGAGSKLFRSVYRTYRTVFPTVLVHPTILPGDKGDASFRNLILVATEQAAPQPVVLADRWEAVRRETPAAPALEKPIYDRHDAEIPVADVPILTDDYAPTDALLLLFQ